MAARLDILAVGISAVDDIVYIDEAPQLNGKHAVCKSTRHAGGLAATAMAAAARLGGAVSYVARFDEGELSRFMTRRFDEFGVRTDGLIRDPQGEPYHSVSGVDAATGSRTIFYDCRNFRQPTAADLSD